MSPTRCRRTVLAAVLLAALFRSGAAAPGPSQVRHTEVVSHPVRRMVRLPGSVESRTASVVASEAEALVVAVPVDEGDRVREGDTLARLRTVYYEIQLRAAEGRLKEALARLDLADSKLKRAKRLFADEVISQDEMDDAHSEFVAWQGREDQSRAEIAELELVLDRCSVRAPFDGVVVRVRTEVGEWMQRGGPVVEMIAVQDLEVEVDVPERYYDLLRRGAEAVVGFESIEGLTVTGEVTDVIPRADPQARSFPVKVRIPNPDGRVGVGMVASVDLPIGRNEEALIVPKDAIVRQGDREIVYRINGDDTVEAVAVRSGQGVDAWVVVDGPVGSGDRVVTRGNERLRPGQAVSSAPLEYPLP